MKCKTLVLKLWLQTTVVVQPDRVRRALCSCVKMDSWLLKQHKSVESGIDILGITSSTVDGSPAKKKVCCVWWSSHKHNFNGRNLGRHLTTKHKVLLIFGTTYLCEKTFSAMPAIKSQDRNHLQLESDLRVAVSTIQPRMSHLVSNMQAHPSHWVSTVSHFYTLFLWLA
jgi:hypothetical protein